MTPVKQLSEVWQTLPWKQFQRNVFRLQKRIYQAKRRNDVRTVRNLQRLLLRSWSARCLAVRKVSQDNRGKRTAGVDGVASLHPRKWWQWCYRRYWRKHLGKIRFSDGIHYLHYHDQTAIKRHTKVISSKSPFDGDWVYWAQRLMRDPLKPLRVVKLLKWQSGKCEECGLPFSAEDVVEVHHVNGNHSDNRHVYLSLLHGHCHDLVHSARC